MFKISYRKNSFKATEINYLIKLGLENELQK